MKKLILFLEIPLLFGCVTTSVQEQSYRDKHCRQITPDIFAWECCVDENGFKLPIEQCSTDSNFIYQSIYDKTNDKLLWNRSWEKSEK